MLLEQLRATLLAWAEAAPSRVEVVMAEKPTDDKRPWIRLERPGWTLTQCAEALGDVLSVQPIFVRSGLPMWAKWSKENATTLEIAQPKPFSSWVEEFVTMWDYEAKEKTPMSMKNEDAGRLLSARPMLKKLRQVDRVNPVRLPVLRASGAIELLPEGYDAESKTLTQVGLDYPVDMSFQDAWELLASLLQEFPFAKEPVDDTGETLSADRNLAVAISAMVGVYAAGLLPQDSLSPAFLYVANTEGAGKTLLASLALVPVYGQMVVQPPPKDEEKLKQELLALVMGGSSYVVFDNWRGQVASSALEAFITATHYQGRVMRENVQFEGRKEVTVFITGNNCTTNGDMRRRSLMCDLFVEEARAEDRAIANRMDIPAIQARRGEILAALWALVKHWDAQKRPVCSREHGSFAAWSRVIGGIVETARFGCCVGESRSTRSGDIYLQQMTTLCEAAVAQLTEKGENSSTTPPASDCRNGGEHAGATGGRVRLTFEGVVALCQEHGLFEDLLDEDKDGNLDRKCRASFARMLKRYDARVFKGIIRMTSDGAGHGRKYVFEKLRGC